MPPKGPSITGAGLYSVHPSVEMARKSIAALKEKTGRTLQEWVRLISTAGPSTDAQRRDWLRQEHGLGTNCAAWLVECAAGRGEDGDAQWYLRDAARYVEEMYGGAKTGLRPVHDAIMNLARKLGKDVRICPCKTIVPLFRSHVFAQIKTSTRTRLDLGLALGPLAGKKKLPERLIDTGGLARKDRITHRIALTSVDELDADVERWLRTAYELDA